MNSNASIVIGNAILWGAASISAAILGAPVVLSTVILPTLAFTSLCMNMAGLSERKFGKKKK